MEILCFQISRTESESKGLYNILVHWKFPGLFFAETRENKHFIPVWQIFLSTTPENLCNDSGVVGTWWTIFSEHSKMHELRLHAHSQVHGVMFIDWKEWVNTSKWEVSLYNNNSLESLKGVHESNNVILNNITKNHQVILSRKIDFVQACGSCVGTCQGLCIGCPSVGNTFHKVSSCSIYQASD